MEERVALPQFFRAGFGAQVAICAIGPIAFEACTKVEWADGIAPMTVGAGFPGIGKIHIARAIGLQQHLDEGIGAPLLAEVFLVVDEQAHEARHQCSGYSNDRKIAGCHQPNLIIQRLEEGQDDLGEEDRPDHRPDPDLGSPRLGLFVLRTVDTFKKHVHRAHMRTENPPFFHGKDYDGQQQPHDGKQRIEHSGQTEVLAINPHALVFQIETKKSKRNAQKNCNAQSLDNPTTL
jgi:hypothetical protein